MARMGATIGGGTAGVDVPPVVKHCPHGRAVEQVDRDGKHWRQPCPDCQLIFLRTCAKCSEKNTLVGRMVGTRCDWCQYDFIKNLFGPSWEDGRKWIFPFDPLVTYGLPFPPEEA